MKASKPKPTILLDKKMIFGVNYTDKILIWTRSQKYWPKSNFGQSIRFKTPNGKYQLKALKHEPTFCLDQKWPFETKDTGEF